MDFLDLEVERPLPPLQVLPASLAPLAAASLLPIKLSVDGLPEPYQLFNGREDLALEVLHSRAVEALTPVPPFGFSCEGRRFVVVLAAYRDASTALAQLDAACDLLDLMPEHVWQTGEQWAATRPLTDQTSEFPFCSRRTVTARSSSPCPSATARTKQLAHRNQQRRVHPLSGRRV